MPICSYGTTLRRPVGAGSVAGASLSGARRSGLEARPLLGVRIRTCRFDNFSARADGERREGLDRIGEGVAYRETSKG